MNIAASFDQATQRWPERVIQILGDTEITYTAQRNRAAGLASALRAAGVAAGDRVACIVPNCLEFTDLFFACASIPCTLVPIDANLTAAEVAAIVDDVAPRLLTAAPGAQPLLDAAREACGHAKAVPFKTLLAMGDAAATYRIPDHAPQDLALILYTSGTVGGSKGVMLSYDNLAYSPNAMLERFSDVRDEFILGLPVPISHIIGPLYLLALIQTGGTLVIMERFAPRRFLEELERHHVTITALVPPMIQALMQLRDWQQFPLHSLRYMLSFGAMASQEVLKSFIARFPNVEFSTGYGLTETAPLLTLVPKQPPAEKFGSVGLPLPTAEIRIAGDDNQPLPAGEVGEIIARGPMLMRGYWRNQDATDAVIRDEWFHTGDVGYVDDDGYLFIVGRTKDIINVAGLKVFAPEVEDVLYAHPAVGEVAVIAARGRLKGEVVKAVVKLRDDTDATEQQLIDHCRARLAEFKVPRLIEFRAEPLPRSRTGKINKEALKNP
ncbi:MAG: AMP-binding protein [Pseudomonadota bacterium]|nr:AMP-binding protein [Pseudomonadota bacterium]